MKNLRILLLSDNNYLLGLFKGYCLNVDCEVKAMSDCNGFYSEINKKPPLLIFIDMEQLPQLLSIVEFQEAHRFIKENHIILCGFGKQTFNNENIQAKSAFKKIFPEPYNEDEILLFLQETLIENELLKNDRRNGKRRNKTDRRKFYLLST